MGLGISLLVTLPALDGISLFGTELSVFGPTAAGTAGLVGASIIDRILDSGEESAEGGNDGGGDALMDDDGAFGGMDGGGDDFGGMDGGMDDGMDGGMDDWGGDDDFGDGGGGGGGNVDELEHQVDELENEVASLSSTVNTVKSENTEISDRIEDVEEDVRNLLDIYEMVTRGINPFVDEQDANEFDVGGGGGGGGLGLFDSEDDDDDSSESQQDDDTDDVMSADADGFFDDELAEDDPDDEFGDELAEDDADEFGEETESEEMVSDQDSTGGKSFSELKDEYDSGDASWAEEDAEDDEFGEMDGMDESLDDGDDEFGEMDGMDESFDGDDEFDEMNDMDESFDDTDEFGEMDEPEDSLSNGSEGSVDATADDADFEYVTSDQLSSEGKKPYLKTLPGDYVGDLVVMEWLEFLVEESSVTDTARAVNYYERIEWIDEPVADHLRSFLSGFGDIDRNKVDRPGTDQLTRTHHVHSLKYIMKLNNGQTATSVILDRWDTFTKGGDGI
jgi:archaellum component FlaD/FlaE/archaellum component FlaC